MPSSPLPQLSKEDGDASRLDRLSDPSGMGLLQKSCKSGLWEHAIEMLNAGMDPRATAPECSSAPLLLAAFGGYHRALEVLRDHKFEEGKVDFSARERDGGETALLWVLSRPNAQVIFPYSTQV